ncbi:MAG: winged helix-turn-helix transcriptional regulator [Gammaproteobacteria bacterium]|nr:MAG: winged helix-turn-helix transcriptional regulator [Gammaproteobacteria bacterium]
MRNKQCDGSFRCPVEACLEVIGGKWKGVILFHLLGGTKRFNALRRLLPGVTQRMLTRQLRELEADQIVVRTVYPEVPPKVEYSLSEFGKTLEPILRVLQKWGAEYLDQITAIRRSSAQPIASDDVCTSRG